MKFRTTTGKYMKLRDRIKALVSEVSADMFEREEIVAVALLGALCGQNTFLFGPPGTAKSLIARRVACAFESPTYFEYLMNRFSTPEEVFGPVSIKALKEDHYIRKTDHYLPKAEFAFLDEIWKSSPAILNTLLTLINERIFRNGESLETTPLKTLIAASNETPAPHQGLEALYDRFIIRIMVGPISERGHFDQLLASRPVSANRAISSHICVKTEEWEMWAAKMHSVKLTTETLTIVHLIREKLAERYEELKVYVSDRRWQRAAMLMKASAFFNDRQETNHADAVLLKHCLWTQEDNRQAVIDIVADAIKACGFATGHNLADIDRRKESLDEEINKELYFSSDVYETKNIDGKEFFRFQIKFPLTYSNYRSQTSEAFTLYIPYEKIKSTGTFSPLDDRGNTLSQVTCRFDGQGSCEIRHSDQRSYEPVQQKLKVLFHRGDKKPDINPRLISSLSLAIADLRGDLTLMLHDVEAKNKQYAAHLNSPFISGGDVELALDGIRRQIKDLELRIFDCKRLEALCQ